MNISVEYGGDRISVEIPFEVDVKGMRQAPPAVLLPGSIQAAIRSPIGMKSIGAIAKEKLATNPDGRAVIVVSDNTRPVPYHGKDGLINSILLELVNAGFLEEKIVILIGAGSHRNMSAKEVEEMIGLQALGFHSVQVSNHEYDKEEQLVELGFTRNGSRVKVNKLYLESDLKIVTGLVESHFMAGASGGRKGICPGIVGKETLTLFHGAKFLNSDYAADLVLDGNPLHDEALEVAEMAGCDFLVNVTLDDRMQVTGVFAGDLREAHQEAVRTIKQYVTVPLVKLYDIVIIPAGFVGINHYQAGKAAVEASKALKPGGQIILIAKNTDADPIGGEGYKASLKLLSQHGKDGFMHLISDPHWSLIQEQWQVQMWCKALDVIGNNENFIYLGLEIPLQDFQGLPGLSGWKFAPHDLNGQGPEETIKSMLVKSLNFAVGRSKNPSPDILLLKDGPYGIPVLNPQS